MLNLISKRTGNQAKKLTRSFSHYVDAVIVGGETAGIATA